VCAVIATTELKAIEDQLILSMIDKYMAGDNVISETLFKYRLENGAQARPQASWPSSIFKKN
jgi:hypothetical protein